MHLQVLRRRADVDPVSVVDVGDEGFAALDQRREEAALDRPRRVFRNAIERVRLEHVDAGVDRVAGDFILARLFQEALDVALRVGLDQAVGARVLDRRQHDGRLRLALAVQPQHGAEINVGQHVAVEDHDRIGQRIASVADCAAGAERHRLDHIAKPDAEPGAFSEDLFDAPRLIVQAEDDLVDFRHLLEKIDLVVEKRPVQDGHNRLRRVDRQRPEPGALPAGKENRFHATSMIMLMLIVDC